MSLNRLIYYGAIVGGWSAFVGWFLFELLFVRGGTTGFWLVDVLMVAFVGAAIGGGLGVLTAFAGGEGKPGMLRRLRSGLAIGLGGGFLGGLLGQLLVAGGVPHVFGWILVGLPIGAAEGIYERSPERLRNGVIGGALGGFVAGLLFVPIAALMKSGGGMAARATGFVILGMCIGVLVNLAQVMFRQAWLTVVSGFRPGRQVILTEAESFLGTAERIALTFISFGAKGVEPRHVRILRQQDGSYALADNKTRSGTKVNGQPVTGPVALRDGDVIAFGVNSVQFSERRRAAPQPLTMVPGDTVRAVPQPSVVPPGAVQPAASVAPAPMPLASPARPPAAPPPGAIPVRAVPAAPPPASVRPPAPVRPVSMPVACPTCGTKAVGEPGKRFCTVCRKMF